MTADRLTPQRETEIAEEAREDLVSFCLVALPNEPGFERAAHLADRFEAAVRAQVAAELAAVRAERDGFRDQRNAVFATNERLLAKVEELGQARLQAENETRTARREVAAVRAERDALSKRLHDAAMTRTWRNEDGKKFVFVEDIAPALLGLTPGTEEGR